MPNSRFPGVVGFDVPASLADGTVAPNEPLVALLDVSPTANWVRAFSREVASLAGSSEQ